MGNTESTKEPEEVKFPPYYEESKILMKTELSEEEDEQYLQGLHLIWFDPNIDSAENIGYKKDLAKLFKMKNYVNSRKALKAALKAVKEIPIIVISCGRKYEKIGKLIENSSQVVMIAIFCFNLQLHLHKLKRHIKIAAVINTFKNLEKELKEGYKNYVRFSCKFLDDAEEQTFHELKDQQEILDGQGMKGIFFEKESNITYPLYYKAFNFKKEEWQKALKRIWLASSNDNLCKSYERKDLAERIEELSKGRLPTDIISAYTGEGLHPMFGRAFRKGKKKLLDLFRLFGFALRGSMGLLGNFIDPGKPLFRGLNLKAEHMKRWEDNLGKTVLLNGYTSTSLDKGLCVTGTFKGNCLMEFRFTKEVEIFEDSLDVFNKLWSGYYSPVDIHKHSAFPDEREILFPPFYPIRIQKITPPHLDPDGIFHIVLLVPTYINIGKGGKFTSKSGNKMTKEMAVAYVERLTILVENEQMTKVDLNRILSNCKGKERERIFRALGGNTHVQYLILGLTHTRIDELGMLFPPNSPQKAWKHLDLRNNHFGDKGAKIVALNLKSLPHLAVLKLGHNDIGYEGIRYLAVNLKFVPKLWNLHLNDNKIRDKGIKHLATNLRFVPKLRKLGLYFNKIRDEGVNSFIQHLECIPKLEDLDLGDNQINEGMEEKMKEIAKEKGIHRLWIQY